MRTMLHAPEFWDPANFRSKMKSPLEMVASAVRAVNGDVDFAQTLDGPAESAGRAALPQAGADRIFESRRRLDEFGFAAGAHEFRHRAGAGQDRRREGRSGAVRRVGRRRADRTQHPSGPTPSPAAQDAIADRPRRSSRISAHSPPGSHSVLRIFNAGKRSWQSHAEFFFAIPRSRWRASAPRPCGWSAPRSQPTSRAHARRCWSPSFSAAPPMV